MWVRGLKLYLMLYGLLDSAVASYVGAWIETCGDEYLRNRVKSHPMWVRGLKLGQMMKHKFIITSHPMWVRGLKLVTSDGSIFIHGRILCGCVD